MTRRLEKPAPMNRRSFLSYATLLPFKLKGVSELLIRPTLIGVFVSGSGMVACNESKISGPTETQNNGGKTSKGNLRGKSSSDAGELDDTEFNRPEEYPTNNEDQSNTGGNTPYDSERNDNPSTKIISKVAGARPNAGFFSRGAPQISKEQIESGVAIQATCEGTNHKLLITPEHLAQLAEGKTVQIKSETKTHFGNPTVHNHTVTYTPIRA